MKKICVPLAITLCVFCLHVSCGPIAAPNPAYSFTAINGNPSLGELRLDGEVVNDVSSISYFSPERLHLRSALKPGMRSHFDGYYFEYPSDYSSTYFIVWEQDYSFDIGRMYRQATARFEWDEVSQPMFLRDDRIFYVSNESGKEAVYSQALSGTTAAGPPVKLLDALTPDNGISLYSWPEGAWLYAMNYTERFLFRADGTVQSATPLDGILSADSYSNEIWQAPNTWVFAGNSYIYTGSGNIKSNFVIIKPDGTFAHQASPFFFPSELSWGNYFEKSRDRRSVLISKTGGDLIYNSSGALVQIRNYYRSLSTISMLTGLETPIYRLSGNTPTFSDPAICCTLSPGYSLLAEDFIGFAPDGSGMSAFMLSLEEGNVRYIVILDAAGKAVKFWNLSDDTNRPGLFSASNKPQWNEESTGLEYRGENGGYWSLPLLPANNKTPLSISSLWVPLPVDSGEPRSAIVSSPDNTLEVELRDNNGPRDLYVFEKSDPENGTVIEGGLK